MIQNYAGNPVQAYALDLWNGSVAQCNSFIDATGITYPMLLNAGTDGIATSYATSWDASFVVDGAGVIVYRGFGFNQNEVTTAIDAALAELVSGVDDLPNTSAFHLNPVYPNPFNPSATISWSIGTETGVAAVKVEIHDIRGRLVASLLNAHLEGGREHSVTWNGLNNSGQIVPSGTYLAAVYVDGTRKARFLTLVK